MTTIELPAIDDILSRLKAVEETTAVLEKTGKQHPIKDWYTVQESAGYLSVSSRTVRRLIARGLLKRSVGTRHIRISRAELEEYNARTII
jgi:excisionase family DNA binding protein